MNGSVCCGTLAGTIVKMLIRKSSFPIRSRALAMGQIAIVIRSNPESVSSAALVSVALVQALFRKSIQLWLGCVIVSRPELSVSWSVCLQHGPTA